MLRFRRPILHLVLLLLSLADNKQILNANLQTRYFKDTRSDKNELSKILRAGDLLEFNRPGQVYNHWAVCVKLGSNPKIIHMTLFTRGSSITIPPISLVPGYNYCEQTEIYYGCPKIVKSNLWDLIESCAIRINNEGDIRKKPLRTEQIIHNAHFYFENFHPSQYDFLRFNCEHFAKLCRNGEAQSSQVADFYAVAAVCLSIIPALIKCILRILVYSVYKHLT